MVYVVIGRLSKYGNFIPLRVDSCNTTIYVEAFTTNVAKLHAILISSDKDKAFTSKF